jgi:hypothetical protein
VNTAIAVGSALLMMTAAKGICNLQWWLERTDYQRHFED